MNPNIKFVLMALVSIGVGTIVAIIWANISLTVGRILKKRYGLTSSDFNNSSNHSRSQRQHSGQQIETAYGIKSFYQRYHYRVVGSIDRIFQQFYGYLDRSPNEHNENDKTYPENNSRDFKSLIHSGDSIKEDSTKCKQNRLHKTDNCLTRDLETAGIRNPYPPGCIEINTSIN